MIILNWVVGVGFLVLAVFYLWWMIQKRTKYILWAELGLWILLVVQFGTGNLSLVDSKTYLGVGILLAFIARIVRLIQGRKS